jgi:hypothetical protein
LDDLVLHSRDAQRTLPSAGLRYGEVAGDFMFWPTGKHRFGWFLEPAYDYSFRASTITQRRLAITAELRIRRMKVRSRFRMK